MGMFDEVRCDYPIPDNDYELFQTKDIAGDIGGTGSLYYIDPAGLVWYIDYYGCCEWVQDSTQPKPWPYKRLQTGKHGRVKHLSTMTKYLTIYPTMFRGFWKDIPKYRLHIVNGKVQSYTTTTEHPDAFRNSRYYSF